jgi:hypothetical protein
LLRGSSLFSCLSHYKEQILVKHFLRLQEVMIYVPELFIPNISNFLFNIISGLEFSLLHILHTSSGAYSAYLTDTGALSSAKE